MFMTLYAKAEYGDITLMRPEDFRANTSVVFINVAIAENLLY
jgi:hypothetical protein